MVGVIDWSQDFENALGDGTPVTNANLTGNQFRQTAIGSGNAAEIDTSAPLAGSRSLRCVKGSGSIQRTQLYAYLGAGDPTAAFRIRFRMVARPAGSTTETIARGFTGATGSATPSANKIDVILTSTGRLQINDVAGASASSAAIFNAGGDYYVEGFYDSTVPGSGAGTLTCRAYNATTLTPIGTVSLATMGVHIVNEWALGEISANASNLDITFDQVAFGHGDYLARPDVTLTPPAVIAQADKTSSSGTPASVTATASATSPATVTSVAASCISNTAGVSSGSIAFTNTLTGGGTGAASVSSVTTTNLFAGTYVFRFTVTDSNGLANTDDVTVKVDTTSSLAESIVSGGGGTAVGAADVMTALRDGSTAGYALFVAPNVTVSEYKVSPVRPGSTVTVIADASLAAAGTGTVLVELFEGATNRTPGRSPQSLSISFVEKVTTLTTGEINSIVDWGNLRVRTTFTSP